MERIVEGRLVIKTANMTGAVALRGFINSSPLAERYREPVLSTEIIPEPVIFCEADDFEEYEIGHDLPKGTFRSIFESFAADLELKREKSVINTLRWRQSEQDERIVLFAAEDLSRLAEDLLAKRAKVRGIGPKRAQRLLDGTALIIALEEAYPDTSQVA